MYRSQQSQSSNLVPTASIPMDIVHSNDPLTNLRHNQTAYGQNIDVLSSEVTVSKKSRTKKVPSKLQL